MSQYNIEMNQYDGSNYNQLYPMTILDNIQNWKDILYTKEEVDEQISTSIKTQIPEMDLTRFKLLVATNSLNGTRGNIVLPQNNNTYNFLLFEFINFDGDSRARFTASFGDSYDSNKSIFTFYATSVANCIVYIGRDKFCSVYYLKEYDTYYPHIEVIDLSPISNNIRWYTQSDSASITRGRVNIYGY